MKTRIKICGITNLQDAQAAVNCGVDILGFNFYKASPRYINPEATRAIIRQLPFYLGTAGILVQPRKDEMLQIAQESLVNALQVYEPLDIHDFHDFPIPIIYCIRLQDGEMLKIPENGAAMILLDTYSKSEYGGTGKRFDWAKITNTIPRERLILAGGIDTDNVEEALRIVNPAVVDVASGAEIEPGKKDEKKMAELVKKIESFNQKNFQ